MEISEEKIEQVSTEAFNDTIARVKQLVDESSKGVNVLKADEPAVTEYLKYVYKICETPVPENIVVAGGLLHARELAGDGGSEMGCGVARLNQLVYCREGLKLIGDPPDADLEVELAFAFRAYDLHAGKLGVVLVPYPSAYETDDAGALHYATGPAVAWPNGEKYYYWHGQMVPEQVILRPEEVTREFLEGVKHAEVRRACFEAIGFDRAIKALDLKAVDTHVDSHGLSYELYKSGAPGRNNGDVDAWLRMQSPALQDGSQPWYTEPVHEDCKTCSEALAWRATGSVDGEGIEYEIVT